MVPGFLCVLELSEKDSAARGGLSASGPASGQWGRVRTLHAWCAPKPEVAEPILYINL